MQKSLQKITGIAANQEAAVANYLNKNDPCIKRNFFLSV